MAALVATMSREKINGSSYRNIVLPCNPLGLYPSKKNVKEMLAGKTITAHGITFSCVPSSSQSCSKATSSARPKPSVSSKQNKKANTIKKVMRKKHADSQVDEKFIIAVVERVKAELPSLIESFNNTPSHTLVSETYDAIYRSQIAAAQEFLNENRNADLSRVKCLLHKLLPKEYFDYIEQLREHQDPQTIVNIMGGQNIVAPNAKSVTQEEKKSKD